MSDDTNLNLLLMPEELMIVHFARNKGIGPCRNGRIKQERPCPSTESHLLYRAAKQLVALHALHVESLTKPQDPIVGSHFLGQISDKSFSTFHTSDLFLTSQEPNIPKSQFLGDFEVYTTCRSIHIGVHGDDGNIIFNGLAHSTLHIVLVCYPRQFSEYQRMMAHDEITSLLDGLINHRLGHVKTQQCP